MPPPDPLAPLPIRSEGGQASVELVAAVPFVLLCAAVAWQLALAGQAAWLCANAARVAARADAVGRDSAAAARSALPGPFRRGMEVSRAGGRVVRVRVHVPLLLLRRSTPIVVSASAGLPRGGP
jgi:pilus assembly protein CpaE